MWEGANSRQIVNLGGSPSLLYGNLASSVDGGHFAYVHKNEVVVVSSECFYEEEYAKATVKAMETVQKTSFIKFNGGKSFIASGCNKGFEIHKGDGSLKIFAYDLPHNQDPNAVRESFFRGAVSVGGSSENAVIAAGTSTGTVCLFKAARAAVSYWMNINCHETPVTDLAVSKSGSLVAVSAEDGKIVLLDTTDWSVKREMFGYGFPCTGVKFSHDDKFLISSFSTGHVRLWNVETGSLVVEIAAHCRSCTAIDAHPSKAFFASVGEDSYLHLWRLNGDTVEVDKVWTACVSDSVLTGVRFTGKEFTTLATVSYDVDGCMFWNW